MSDALTPEEIASLREATGHSLTNLCDRWGCDECAVIIAWAESIIAARIAAARADERERCASVTSWKPSAEHAAKVLPLGDPVARAIRNLGAGVNAVDHAAKGTHDEATSPQGVPAPAPVPHNHPERVPGCHRCELTSNETGMDA